MNDPRKEQTWKQKRYEERVLLLLGAILDSVKPEAAPEVVENPNSDTPRRGRPRKVNA